MLAGVMIVVNSAELHIWRSSKEPVTWSRFPCNLFLNKIVSSFIHNFTSSILLWSYIYIYFNLMRSWACTVRVQFCVSQLVWNTGTSSRGLTASDRYVQNKNLPSKTQKWMLLLHYHHLSAPLARAHWTTSFHILWSFLTVARSWTCIFNDI